MMLRHTLLLSLFLVFCFFFSSCVENSNPRKGRPTVSSLLKSTQSEDSLVCSNYIVLETQNCVSECPEGTSLVSSDDVQDRPSGSANATGFCQTTVSRPSNSIWFESDFCGCYNQNAYLVGNCDAFCKTVTATTPTLFASVKLGDDVLLNESLGNLYNWCNAEIDDGFVAPSCVLELSDGQSTQFIALNLHQNNNHFTASIAMLEENKTYLLRIKEITSKAVSDYIQLRRTGITQSVFSMIPISPLAQYTCITRTSRTLNGQTYYDNSFRLHYYFPVETPADPLSNSSDNLFCHDRNLYGVSDGPLVPRLELVQNTLTLWSKKDLRFFDLDQNNQLDINQKIEERLNNGSEINLFQPLSYNISPETGSVLQGFYLQAFINEDQSSFCPKTTNYSTATPIFTILKELIGTDTEGFWIAKREPLTVDSTTISAPDDYLFIRESTLKKVWFYSENGILYPHNESTARSKKIMFFAPFDEKYPLVRKSNQLIYTVFHPLESAQTGAIRTQFIPSDKRIGCIPQYSP